MPQQEKIYRRLDFMIGGGPTPKVIFNTSESATILYIRPDTDDTGAINIGDGTKDIDVKVFLGTSAKYALFDVGNVLFQLEDVDLLLGDNDILEFGDASGGDVAIKWNATNLVITPAVDDTGAIYFGNGTLDMDVRIHQGTTTDYVEFDVGAKALEIAGDTRLDLSGATVAAANTDGGLIKGGTAAARIVEDTANMKFMSFYFDDGAASGSAEGLYIRLYGTGTLGTAQALRAFTTVEDVVIGTARGAHISLNFGASGTITGLGSAVTTTLHIPNDASQTGTLTSVNAEIYSDGATSDPAGATSLSYFRISNGGNATGALDVDTDAVLFEFNGSTHTAGSGNLLDTTASAATGDATIKIRWSDGTTKYLLVADDPN